MTEGGVVLSPSLLVVVSPSPLVVLSEAKNLAPLRIDSATHLIAFRAGSA